MDRKYRRAGQSVRERAAGVQQGGQLRLPAPAEDPAAAQLPRRAVARPAPENHREQQEAAASRQEKDPPVQPCQSAAPLPQKPRSGHQRPGQRAGEQKEQQHSPQESLTPPKGKPYQPRRRTSLRREGREHPPSRQGAQRPICTAQQRCGQHPFPLQRQSGQTARDIQRGGIGEAVE